MREGRQQLFLLRDLPDQRPPLRNFLPDLRAELLERGLGRIGASVAHGLLHLRIVGQLDQELRELADDGLRSLRRSHDGVPRLHNEIGKNYLMNRRKIGQVGAAIERISATRRRSRRSDRSSRSATASPGYMGSTTCKPERWSSSRTACAAWRSTSRPTMSAS